MPRRRKEFLLVFLTCPGFFGPSVVRDDVRLVPIADIEPLRELGCVSPATRSETWLGLLGDTKLCAAPRSSRGCRWRFYLVRLTVKARAPSFVLNFRPELTVRLRTVAHARLYSSVTLDVMPITRRLRPLFNASSLFRSFVFPGIAFSVRYGSLLC